jgi:DNA-binding NarL/FixJ family response regulator
MDALRSRTTVLLIDPQKEDRESWTQRLNISAPDFVVLEADTGKAALAICHSHRIDCTIVELSLPDMSGFEVLVKLVPRAFKPANAVIFLARQGFDTLAKLAVINGAQGYFVKSEISGDVLDQAIRKAIAVVGRNKCRER